MTPAALMLARDGDAAATATATALWTSIVGSSPDSDETRAYGAALDAVGALVGSATDVPAATLGEAVKRTGGYLDRSRSTLGFHGALPGGTDADPRTGGYSALRRSGSTVLLLPWTVKRAGVV